MFSISNHAIERYIERILGVDLTEEELQDFLKEAGAEICQTITGMVKDSDLMVSIDQKYYTMFRNIVIVIKDIEIVTIYKIHQETDDFTEYVDSINMNKDILKKLIFKRQEARFTNQEVQKKYTRRIRQYTDFMFCNELVKD